MSEGGIMNKAWLLPAAPVLLLLLLAFGGTGVEGIRCNFCTKSPNNDDCNAQVAECTNQKHDACFTTVTWIDTNTKYYTKGCNKYEDCHKLETEDRDKCDKSVMNCTYCCRDRSTCNAYNAASPTVHARSPTALVPVLSYCLLGYVTLLMVSQHRFQFLYKER